MAREPLALVVHGVSHTHARWLLDWSLPDAFRVVALVEPDAGLRDRFARAFGLSGSSAVPRFADLPPVDAEAVAGFGPVSEHTGVVADAARAGLAVMLEKPLATATADAERIAELAARHRVGVFTHYETDAYASLAALAVRLQAGDIGTPLRITAAHGHPGPVERGVNAECLAWLADPARDGGAITDFGCYGIAQTLWLLGGRLPERVTAHGWTRKPERYPGVEDDATLVLDHGDASAAIQPSWCWPYDRKELTVFGPGGSLHARSADELIRRNGDGSRQRLDCPTLPLTRADPFVRLASFIRDSAGPAETDPTHLSNAVATARVLEAARRSAREGRGIRLAL